MAKEIWKRLNKKIRVSIKYWIIFRSANKFNNHQKHGWHVKANIRNKSLIGYFKRGVSFREQLAQHTQRTSFKMQLKL
jgi:hypothetical protein